MADTHINAYFTDVDEAEKRMVQAHAEWEAAKLRLENKKKEVGFEEPMTAEAEEPDQVEEKPPEVTNEAKANNSLFGGRRR